MKKIILNSNKAQFRKISAIFLALVIVASISFLLFTKLNVPTDMLSLLPKEQTNPLKEEAFRHVSKEASQKIIILFGDGNQQKSYAAASFFYKKISEIPFLEQSHFYSTSQDKNELTALYFPFRYQLLSPNFSHLLKEKQGSKIGQEALKSLYSPVGLSGANSIKEDPFFLGNNFLMSLPFLQTSLAPYKDILMSKYEEKYYSFLALTLAKNSVFSTSELDETMQAIRKIEAETKQEFKGIEMVFSGVPVHSHAGSQQGIAEVNLIGWVSMFLISLMIYFTFKSAKPFIFAVTSIVIGFVVAFAATHLFFGEVHLITIIFGTSLVGVSDDYSIHFFSEYLNRKKKNKDDGMTVLKHIYPGITMGLITSILGYMALIFTPFPGLQQIAFFSTVGFTVSFLTVILFFPKFYKPSTSTYRAALLNLSNNFVIYFQKIISRKRAYYIFAALSFVSIIGISKLQSADSIRLLYSSPKHLIEQEMLARKVLGQNRAVQFFVIEGKNSQEILEKEEILTAKLDGLISEKKLSAYQATSQIVPSVKKQKENLELVKLELINLHLKQQAQAIGLNAKEVKEIKSSLNQAPKFLTVDEVFENQTLKILKPLWIGAIANGNFASIITLDNVTDAALLKNFNDEKTGIYLLDKVEDISNIFKDYRRIALFMLLAVNVVIALLLIYRYGFVNSLFVFFPPVLAGSLTFAIMGFINYPVNLFNILALFLVLGVGIDYAIFYAEDKETSPTTSLAVVLSSITTLLSFGMLSLSSFNVIHSIGLTILFGILFSYLLSPFSTLIHRKK